MAEYTADVDAMGCLRCVLFFHHRPLLISIFLSLLDAIRSCDLDKKVKFYQASTSELYGKVVETPQSETTPFYPRSPYGK